MLKLKNTYKTISCKDMQQGDVAIITESKYHSRNQKGMIILCGYQHYIDLATGDYYGLLSTDAHPTTKESHPSWTVELLEPGTELVIE